MVSCPCARSGHRTLETAQGVLLHRFKPPVVHVSSLAERFETVEENARRKPTRPRTRAKQGAPPSSLPLRPPPHAMLRGCKVGCACSTSGFWPVPLPQARSRVPVRCICCAGMPGFCMMPGSRCWPGWVCARCWCSRLSVCACASVGRRGNAVYVYATRVVPFAASSTNAFQVDTSE